jgi:Fic-DOC domain mobile mystery protein B
MTGVGDEPHGATPLDPDELDGLRFKHITTRAELNELEQVNVQNGLSWLQRRRKGEILTEQFVRQLHRQLFGEIWNWAGDFRRTEKNIGVDPIQVAIQLRVLLDDALYWSENDTYSALEAAARFHHRLVQIHCFPNGNGRHARIMSDAYLKHCFGHSPVDWAAGHDLMGSSNRRDSYISALRSADAGQYDPLLTFIGAS